MGISPIHSRRQSTHARHQSDDEALGCLQMTRHLAALRESQSLPPFARAWLSLVTLTFEHWAEITLCQRLVRASQCFALIREWDPPLPAPLLSWLFTAQRSPETFLVHQFSTCTNPPSTCIQVFCAQLKRPKRPGQDPCAQPSELILVPKLRTYFADFPYLLCTRGQTLLTLGTWCGYGYELECE